MFVRLPSFLSGDAILKSNALAGRLALLLAALIWGSSFVIMKNTVDDLPVFLLLAIRFSISFLVLGAVFFRRLKGLDRRFVLGGMLCGAMLIIAYSLQTFGLVGTTPGKNAVLTAVYCVLVPFMAWMFFRRRPSVWNWLAAGLCVAGIGLVSLDGGLSMAPGDALSLLSGVCYALHIMALSRLGEKGDVFSLSIIQFGTAALLAWMLHLLTDPGAPMPALQIWPQLGYLSVCCTCVAITLQAVGQKLTPPSQAAILLSLESVFGVLFSLLSGAETITFQLAAGFALIFVSVIVSETQLSFLRRRG